MAKKNKGQGPSLDAASANPVVRVIKALVERYAADLGRAVVSYDTVQAGVQLIKSKLNTIFGEGVADAALNSKLVEAGVAGVIQLPWLPRFFAKLIGLDPDLVDDIAQEGVDSMIKTAIEEMAKLPMTGKSDQDVNALLKPSLINLESKLTELLQKNNRAGLEKVWFDPSTGLAHKPECKVVGAKTNVIKNINLMAVEKTHKGSMTLECACVGFANDPAGPLDSVLARLSPHRRKLVLDYIGSYGKDAPKLLLAGNKRRDITAAKLLLVLEIDSPQLKKTQFFHVLGYEEGKKPGAAEIMKKVADKAATEAAAVLDDPKARRRFTLLTQAGTNTNRRMSRLINGS